MSTSYISCPNKSIHDAVNNAYSSGEYSDLQIVCSDRTFNVHRIVVCSQCEFFKNALQSGFSEGQSGKINMQHDQSDGIEALLSYLYTQDYRYPERAGAADESPSYRYHQPVAYHVKAYAAAEKFGIPALKTKSLQYLKTTLQTCTAHKEELKLALKSIYDTEETEPIRKNLLPIIKVHGYAAMNSPQFWDAMRTDFPELGVDIAKDWLPDPNEHIRSYPRRPSPEAKRPRTLHNRTDHDYALSRLYYGDSDN